MYYKYFIIFLLFSFFLLSSCKKQDDFLNAKPNDSFSIPSTLEDLSLLLNNEELFNAFADPAFGAMCGEEYYVLTPFWISLSSPIAKNCYIWSTDIYGGTQFVSDWDQSYQQIYYANTVLDYLPPIGRNEQNQAQYDNVKGSALFLRAYSHYNLVQIFAMPYDSTTFAKALGIPIKLSSDPNIKSYRSTIKEVYEQIITDAKSSVNLLPNFSTKPTAVSKWAAYAFLARVYLAIRDYEQAYSYADSCLNLKTVLTDYELLNPQSNSISSNFLEEDIYHRTLTNYSIHRSFNGTFIDSTLLSQYDKDDLRLTKFFRTNNGGLRFRGSYDFKGFAYSGLAVDEILLIRAESAARTGKVQEGLKDLNLLLQNRYKKGTFIPLVFQQPSTLLARILLERRKELYLRGLRWTDLRRLNLEDEHKITLTRIINNVTYKLVPKDKKYALPIPNKEIQLTGMPQNDR